MKSLFTNVPLDTTITVILRCIYEDKEVNQNIQHRDMKNLIFLCTKNVHVTFDNEIYKQTGDIMMSSLQGQVIAGIIVMELEKFMAPRLQNHSSSSKRFCR